MSFREFILWVLWFALTMGSPTACMLLWKHPYNYCDTTVNQCASQGR